MKKFKLDWLILPLVGVTFILGLWALCSATWAKDLPSPLKTWESSKPYIVEPFAKRGEMDQGILRFTWYSLVLVAQGYAEALVVQPNDLYYDDFVAAERQAQADGLGQWGQC